MAVFATERCRVLDRAHPQVENRLSTVQILTMRADFRRRNYLLIGSADDIGSYNAIRREILPEVDAFVSAVSDNPRQTRRARQFRAIIIAKLDEMQRSISQ